MDSSQWERWVDLELACQPTALIHGPLEHVNHYHPSVLGLVSDRRRTSSTSPGIDVREDVQHVDATITCSVTFGLPDPLIANGRNAKANYPLTNDSFQDYLRKVMYSVCDVISLRTRTLQGAVDEFLIWLDSCILFAKSHNRPSILLSIEELDTTEPRVLTQFETLCTRKIENYRGVETSLSAFRDAIRHCFSDIAIISASIGPEDHYHQMLKVALQDRMKAKRFYSAKTVVRLLEKACEHFASGPNETFCFISSLRREVLPEIPSFEDSRLVSYFRACPDVPTLISFAFPALAFGLARDSCRIGCHRFAASDLFQALYDNLCYTALQTVSKEKSWISVPRWSHCARIICQKMAAHFSLDTETTAELQILWRSALPFSACVLCPFREPRIRLDCGHAVCESCIWHWSRRAMHSSLCRFDECPVCGDTTSFKIRLRPPTAGYRTLSLDGGGIRGIVMLEVLDYIMKCLGTSLEAYQMFDLIVGTSTGSIIACTLGLKQWPLSKCIEEFRTVSQAVFPKRRPLQTFLAYTASLFTDCVYSKKPLVENLKRIFGNGALLCGETAKLGQKNDVKVIVTATTMGPKAVTFANYTELQVTSACGVEGVKVWEAVTASCAAPLYFKPIILGKHEPLQDGGLFRNNPFEIIAATIPRQGLQNPLIDLMLSLGTGSFSAPTGDQNGPARYWWRLFQAFNAHLDGQVYWDQNLSRAGAQSYGKTYRVSPFFHGPEISLNDVSGLGHLQIATRSLLLENEMLATAIREICTSLICSSLYVQIDREPVFNDSICHHTCYCTILLRWQDNKVICDEFRRRLREAFFDFPSGKCPATIPCTLEFSMISLAEPVHIYLNLKEGNRGAISGMPTSIPSLVRMQGGFPQRSIKRCLEE